VNSQHLEQSFSYIIDVHCAAVFRWQRAFRELDAAGIAASTSLGQGPWSPSTVQAWPEIFHSQGPTHPRSVSHPLTAKMWQVFTEPDLPGQPQGVACVSWQQLEQRAVDGLVLRGFDMG
jgi:hypothetical protein